MTSNHLETDLKDGEMVEVVSGIYWGRIGMPGPLDHVNVYVIDDGDGWTIYDTGPAGEVSRLAWERFLSGPLSGRRVNGLIVSHHHPDHIGLAGWFGERLGIPLHMTAMEYLHSHAMFTHPHGIDGRTQNEFYHEHGMQGAVVGAAATRRARYQAMTTGLPETFIGLEEGQELPIGSRRFTVLWGPGHSPCQALLHDRDGRLLVGADHLLGSISPNISVQPMQPAADPLGQYLCSLKRLREEIPDGTLVLPGHGRPFVRVHPRIDDLMEHHRQRCLLIETRCREASSCRVADLLPVLFRRPLDAHQSIFAFGEVLSHVNYLVADGRLGYVRNEDGYRVRALF